MPFPKKKTAASDTVPPRFVLFIVITDSAQSTPFNTKNERAFCATHLVWNAQFLSNLIFFTVTVLKHNYLLK